MTEYTLGLRSEGYVASPFRWFSSVAGVAESIVAKKLISERAIPATQHALYMNDKLITINDELYRHLCADARDRGISVVRAYLDEMTARKELRNTTPPVDEWLRMAASSGAPAYMREDAGGPCPF